MSGAMPSPRSHLPEFAAEAFGLGLFMVSASGFAVLLFHPASPLLRVLPSGLTRGALMGLAMGLTAVLNIYSPWGRRSGAHLNPAVTLTFLRLGKVQPRDAAGYIVAQFIGAVAGTAVAAILFHAWIADPAVNYVATLPGMGGLPLAFVAEASISFLLMLAVLNVSSRPKFASYTGVVAGFLIACYITFESPISGMSMNPARTVGSAVFAHVWRGLWIYLLAPPLGMLLAGELFQRAGRTRGQHCAKLHHDSRVHCIFCGE
jgi:aquaporin Z